MSESEFRNIAEDQLPDDVLAELKNRYGPSPPVPDIVDQAILMDARRFLDGPQSKPKRSARFSPAQWLVLSVSSALAVMLLFAVLPQNPQRELQLADRMDPIRQRPSSEPILTPMILERNPDYSGRDQNSALIDINQDGLIDILDAFALARTIESGNDTDHRWDINGDGELNQNDVDLAARHVVKL